MKEFTIDYTQTEITRQRVRITANSLQEALAIVESHDFDNSYAEEIDILETSFSDAEPFGDGGCPVE